MISGKVKNPEKEGKTQAIQEFRDKHLGELELNLNTLTKIRDLPDDLEVKCPHCGEKHKVGISSTGRDKNRIEASKGIARHLGALQPDKQVADQKKGVQADALDRELSDKEQQELDRFLAEEVIEVVPPAL